MFVFIYFFLIIATQNRISSEQAFLNFINFGNVRFFFYRHCASFPFFDQISSSDFSCTYMKTGRSRIRFSMGSLIFFIELTFPGRSMSLGSTQLLIEMSTRDLDWGLKVADVQGYQPCQLYVPTVKNSGSLKLPKPSGPIQACTGISFFYVQLIL